ncbi:MAG: cobalt-precorrin 5A hydrolase [Eubacteriales bacterium]|nr:cobalt-precorrin 5A hydrolase [Eubacteriales bacterium]
MKAACIAFSRNGGKVCKKTAAILEKKGMETEACVTARYAKETGLDPLSQTVAEWTKYHFSAADLLVFVGATGIAVRSIAPYVRDKKTDPAVIVIDEHGKFVISLLSGHIGGANEWTALLAEELHSMPVVTTATDLNHKMAVDVFAVKNGMEIKEMELAKKIAADFLDQKRVGFLSDFAVKGQMPQELKQYQPSGEEALEDGIHVTIKRETKPFSHTLHLIPKIVALGIGCRKYTKKETIERAVNDMLDTLEIERESISCVCSIELKKEEEGIQQFCREWNLPFFVFSKEELQNAEGEFSSSSFVEQTVGVSNVCERSAVCGSENGMLIQKKRAGDGVTVAAAIKDWSVKF